MASPLDMNHGQMLEFERALIAAGLDSEAVLAVLRSQETATAWVSQLKASLMPPLFTSPEQQLRNAWEWWGNMLSNFELDKAEKQMAELAPSTESLVAWVLVPRFNDPRQTLERLWERATMVHSKHWRSENMKSEPEHLRMLEGIEFDRNTLTWELIDFGAHLGEQPDLVRGSNSAEFGLLAAASQHPTWAMSLGETVNGIFVPYVNVCGLQVRLSDSGVWSVVPYLDQGGAGLGLSVHWAVRPDPGWACPVRRGSSN